jgi:hypothetical protein
MIVADYSMIGELLNLNSGGDNTIGIAQRVRLGSSIFLLEDQARACVVYDPLDKNKKWVTHILTSKDFKGKELWGFVVSTALWMVNERRLEHILSFVAKENKLLRVFVRYLQMNRVATIGDEILYTASAKHIKTFASQKEVRL